MSQQIQQIAPIPNGTIPVMSGVQPTLVYQQQQVVMGPPQQNYIPKSFRNQQDEQCKIFVGGVGKNTSEGSLRAYFGKFGQIADSVIMRDKQSGEPRGFAFVTFKSPDAVQGVIDQSNNGGHTLDGKVVDPKPAVPQGPAQQNKLQAMYDAEKVNQAQTHGNPQYKGPMKVAPELKIFVGGIGIGTTEDDVKQYFESFGPVLQVDMPYHPVYKCPKGFAFVGFENPETVAAITKDRYHQINGKTVEVKGSDEQQAHVYKKRTEGNFHPRGGKFDHMQPGTIGTVSGYGAYANLTSPQIILPQSVGGLPQYATVPAAASGGGYVFDPATNTYYQLPLMAGAAGGVGFGGGGAGVVTSMGGNQYAMINGIGGQQILTSPQLQRHGVMSSDLFAGNGAIAIGAAYASETSTFGPTRTHLLGAGQQPIAGSADPHVVYSTATSISAGDAAISTPRGYHPYGR